MSSVFVALIVARAQNGVIGVDGDLPWRLRDDLAFFKATTHGAPIIMGRKTWQSLPRQPLPGRLNIVLTRDPAFQAPGALVFAQLDAALAAAQARAQTTDRDEVFIVGGEAVYAAALPQIDRMYITEVEAEPAGDARFPLIDPTQWNETVLQRHAPDARNDHGFTIKRFDRL